MGIRRNTTYVYALIVLLVGASASPGSAGTYGSATVDRVTSIYDGDTFRADIAGWPPIIGERVPIRLRGADTPEMRGECQLEKEQARRAKQFTVGALRDGESIILVNIERGKYFRIVADVEIDGRDLSDMLIAAGLARPYDGGRRRSWCD